MWQNLSNIKPEEPWFSVNGDQSQYRICGLSIFIDHTDAEGRGKMLLCKQRKCFLSFNSSLLSMLVSWYCHILIRNVRMLQYISARICFSPVQPNLLLEKRVLDVFFFKQWEVACLLNFSKMSGMRWWEQSWNLKLLTSCGGILETLERVIYKF